ncbi:MAG TPA: CU044_2847 family protein [Iamia sp.]
MSQEMRSVEVVVADGSSVWVPVLELPPAPGEEVDTAMETSVFDKIDLKDLLEPVERVGASVRTRMAALKPDKVQLEVGVAVGVRGGRLVSVLVDGKADVSFKLTLEWDLSDPADAAAT